MVLIAAGTLVAVVAVGFGLDYGRAISLQARLAEAGHAAAMAAASQPMQAQDEASAQGAATSLFVGQVGGLAGLVFDPASGLSVVVSDGASGVGGGVGGRRAEVRWSATYTALFGGLLGVSSLPITGSATAMAQGAANVDFTLALAPASKELAVAAQALGPVAQKLAAQNGVAYGLSVFAKGAQASARYGGALTEVNSALSAPGDGATVGSAQGVVMLLTDGSGGVPGDDDLAACAAIKARGLVLAVLYAPAGNGGRGGIGASSASAVGLTHAAPAAFGGGGSGVAADAVAAGLQACASPQMGGAPLFIQPAPGQSAADALASLFALAAENARLVH